MGPEAAFRLELIRKRKGRAASRSYEFVPGKGQLDLQDQALRKARKVGQRGSMNILRVRTGLGPNAGGIMKRRQKCCLSCLP